MHADNQEKDEVEQHHEEASMWTKGWDRIKVTLVIMITRTMKEKNAEVLPFGVNGPPPYKIDQN